MVATRKVNRHRRQRGGQTGGLPIPPTFTCPPGTGNVIPGMLGMCGKCEGNQIMIGNTCFSPPPPPVMPPPPVPVKTTPATCPAGLNPIPGMPGMCGKCDNNFTLVGNVCVPPPSPPAVPPAPVMVRATPATPTCPPGSKLNGPLCEFPPPPSPSFAAPTMQPASQRMPTYPMKKVVVMQGFGGMPPITQDIVDMSQPPKCDAGFTLSMGFCYKCDNGVFDGGMMCAVCPPNFPKFNNGQCIA